MFSIVAAGKAITPRLHHASSSSGVSSGNSHVGTTATQPYQYNFPNVVKVAPQHPHSPGLSVVSGPAPLAPRPDMGSANSRTALPQQTSLEKLAGLRAAKGGGGAGGGGVRSRMKQTTHTQHTVVYS